MYLNRAELIGLTGSDAETKTTPQGKTVTTFSIATKTSYIKAPREGAPSKEPSARATARSQESRALNGTASRPGAGSGKYAARLQEGLAYLRRRRVAQPRIREQRRQSPHV
jgi:hypothetical protein